MCLLCIMFALFELTSHIASLCNLLNKRHCIVQFYLIILTIPNGKKSGWKQWKIHFCRGWRSLLPPLVVFSLFKVSLEQCLEFLSGALCGIEFNQFSGMTLLQTSNLRLMETPEQLFLQFVGHLGCFSYSQVETWSDLSASVVIERISMKPTVVVVKAIAAFVKRDLKKLRSYTFFMIRWLLFLQQWHQNYSTRSKCFSVIF